MKMVINEIDPFGSPGAPSPPAAKIYFQPKYHNSITFEENATKSDVICELFLSITLF